MNNKSDLDIKVIALLKLPPDQMYKTIRDNVKNKVDESYGDEFIERKIHGMTLKTRCCAA